MSTANAAYHSDLTGFTGSIFPRASRRVFIESLAVVGLFLVLTALVLLAGLVLPGTNPFAPETVTCFSRPDLGLTAPGCWAAY